MKLRRYLDKGQKDNQICLMSIINIKTKHFNDMILEEKIQAKYGRSLERKKPKIIKKKQGSIDEIFDFQLNDLILSNNDKTLNKRLKNKLNQKEESSSQLKEIKRMNTSTLQPKQEKMPLLPPLLPVKGSYKEESKLTEERTIIKESVREYKYKIVPKMKPSEIILNNKVSGIKPEMKFKLIQRSQEKPSKSYKNMFSPPKDLMKIKYQKQEIQSAQFNPIVSQMKFKYLIKAKEKAVIFKIFENRINWEAATDKKNFNFLWKYANKKSFFKILKSKSNSLEHMRAFNHHEYHHEISNKKLLFVNIFDYCTKNDINPFNIIPLTFIISNNKKLQLNNIKGYEKILSLLEQANKSLEEPNLHFNSEAYCKLFSLPIKNSEYKRSYNNVKLFIPSDFYNSKKNLWIVKPDNLCQGKLIQIIDNADDLTKITKKYFNPLKEEKEGKRKTIILYNLIIQKYIENPLLFWGRKFDFRVFLLIDQNFNLYLFREGYLRTCSSRYDIESKDLLIHITNYSLQKQSPDFCKHEVGNEASLKDFQEFLNIAYKERKLDVYKDIMKRIGDVLKIAFLSVADKLNKNNYENTFELYGSDVIMDNDFNPYILEINDNPGIGLTTPEDKLVPRLLDDMFRLTLDKIYPTENISYDKKSNTYKSRFHLEAFDDNENVFEFLCNLKQ